MKLFRGVGLKHGAIGTNLVFELAENCSGDVTAFHGFLVHIVVKGRRSGAEHRADVDVHNGRVGVVGGEVHTEAGTEVVGRAHDGSQVGVALLAGIGHLGQLLGKHPEGEHVAQVALIEVGTLDEDGLRDGGGNDTDGGLGFLFHLLVGPTGAFALAVLLFQPSLLLVVGLEGMIHQEALYICGKLLAAGLWSLDDDLEQEGALARAVVIVVEPDAGGQGAQRRQAGHEAGEFAVQGGTGYNLPYNGW